VKSLSKILGNRPYRKALGCLFVPLPLLFLGCAHTTVVFEEPLPEHTAVKITNNLSLWKSNAGANNELKQNTDATLPISTLGSENPVAQDQ